MKEKKRQNKIQCKKMNSKLETILMFLIYSKRKILSTRDLNSYNLKANKKSIKNRKKNRKNKKIKKNKNRIKKNKNKGHR